VVHGNVAQPRLRQLQKFWVAYDGDLKKQVTVRTTHVLTDAAGWDDTLRGYSEKFSELAVVPLEWALQCIRLRRLLPEQNFPFPPVARKAVTAAAESTSASSASASASASTSFTTAAGASTDEPVLPLST
jgi:hypothetical protein